MAMARCVQPADLLGPGLPHGIGQCGHDASVDTYLAAVHPDGRPTVLAAIERARHASVDAVFEH